MSVIYFRRLLGSWLGIAVLALSVSIIYTVSSSAVVHAASFSSLSVPNKVQSYYLYQAWQDCISIGSMSTSINQTNITDPMEWELNNDWVSVGYVVEPNDGQSGCDTVYKNAVQIFGQDNNKTGFLTAMGYVSVVVAPDGNTRSAGGTFWKFEGCDVPVEGNIGQSTGIRHTGTERSDLAACFRVAVNSKFGNPTFNTAMYVYRNKATLDAIGVHFRKAAGLTQDEWIQFSQAYPNQYGSYNNALLKLIVIDPTVPSITKVPYYAGADFSLDGDTFELGSKDNGQTHERATARQILDALNRLGNDLFNIVQQEIDSGTFDASQYGGFAGVPTPDGGEAQSSCSVDYLGWIVCPVVNFLAKVADASFGFLADHFLRTSPAVFDSGSSTYDAWTVIRNFANIAFVIVFLIIIFSQLSSLGISNYGVKKMLPRLIIAAILVNVSYFIAQIAVDVSNILGYSVKSLFDSIATSATPIDVLPGNQGATGGGFAGIAGSVLGIGMTLTIGYALLSTLVPVLLAAVVALVMILFILVARQALIILLVVISPLAFVAFLLPNTEQWFKKWQKTFTALLLVFPMVAVVFGASTLASTILTNTYSLGGNEDTGNWFGQIIAAAILVLPLFVVPSLLKKSLDGLPALGKLASKLSSSANGNVNKKLKESYQNSLYGRGSAIRKQARQNYQGTQFANKLKGKGLGAANRLVAYGTAAIPIGGQSKAERAIIGRVADSAVDEVELKEIKDERALIQKNASAGVETQSGAFDRHAKSGDIVGMRAAISEMAATGKGRDDLHRKITSVVDGADFNPEHRNKIKQYLASQHSDLVSKDTSLAMYGYGLGDMAKLESGALSPSDYASLTPERMVTHTKAGLVEAQRAGMLSSQTATDILKSEKALSLAAPEREFLERISNGGIPAPIVRDAKGDIISGDIGHSDIPKRP